MKIKTQFTFVFSYLAKAFTLLLIISSASVFADVNVEKVSWVKDAPRGNNLYKVKAGDKLILLSAKRVQGYIKVESSKGAGWIYAPRVSVSADFKTIPCGSFSPYGMPNTNKELDIICRSSYSIGYDRLAKIPTWVSYIVSVENSHSGNVPRSTNGFMADTAIPSSFQANDGDYLHSGFDKGHMAGSASLDANRVMNDSTFLYTNITPQLPGFNRDMMGYKGAWGRLEHVIRKFAYEKDLLVLSGAYYTGASKTIGGGVVVPDAFYKIILDTTGTFVGAFWLDHVAGGSDQWKSLSTSIDYIEGRTGYDFFPNLDSELVEAEVVRF